MEDKELYWLHTFIDDNNINVFQQSASEKYLK